MFDPPSRIPLKSIESTKMPMDNRANLAARDLHAWGELKLVTRIDSTPWLSLIKDHGQNLKELLKKLQDELRDNGWSGEWSRYFQRSMIRELLDNIQTTDVRALSHEGFISFTMFLSRCKISHISTLNQLYREDSSIAKSIMDKCAQWIQNNERIFAQSLTGDPQLLKSVIGMNGHDNDNLPCMITKNIFQYICNAVLDGRVDKKTYIPLLINILSYRNFKK
jgi:hypothetical protein